MIKGSKHTSESLLKMKLSQVEASKKRIPWNKGKKTPFEVKVKISIATKKAMANLPPEKRVLLSPKGLHKSPNTEFKKGRIYTQQERLEISERAKRLGIGNWMKGRIPAFITQGKHFEFPVGENHPNWQGGKSFEPYTTAFNKQLKERVRVRDNFICQLCNVPELECCERLSIHHIDYNKKNCEVTNLITLCRSCNAKVNGNRNYWQDYFLKKVMVAGER